ncbi:MAG: TadE/TadG family type IV pilus assembly protein [Chloroflexota bacterium]
MDYRKITFELDEQDALRLFALIIRNIDRVAIPWRPYWHHLAQNFEKNIEQANAAGSFEPIPVVKPEASERDKRQQGQSLVEFALVLIFVIIPLTFALIETSVLLYKYVALSNAAREGVRAGSVYLFVGDPGGSSAAPDAGRSAAVVDSVRGTVGPLIVPPPDCNGTGAGTICQITYGPSSFPIASIENLLRSTDVMTVTITHTHPFLFGALGGAIDLNAQATMRIEPSTVISGAGP